MMNQALLDKALDLLAPKTAILWAATASGYKVQTVVDGQITDEYNAGNSARCSQTYVDDDRGVGLEQMRAWAEQTAKETADTLRVPHSQVEEDADLLEELKEELA